MSSEKTYMLDVLHQVHGQQGSDVGGGVLQGLRHAVPLKCWGVDCLLCLERQHLLKRIVTLKSTQFLSATKMYLHITAAYLRAKLSGTSGLKPEGPLHLALR